MAFGQVVQRGHSIIIASGAEIIPLAVTLSESTRAVRASLTERDLAAAKRALSAVGDDDES
jgi:hypothetical protein